MAVVEFLTDYKRKDSSKVESLEDSHATGGGDEVSRDHNALRMGSGKTLNVREGRGKTKNKDFTLKTFLPSRVQVKEAKWEQAKVARTHMDKVTKGEVNSMGKRKQYSKHRKCSCLHPSKASQENEVKNILTERVTKRQGVLLVIEYLVQWK